MEEEVSESVYLRTTERAEGVAWLESQSLPGYVLEPRGQWLQVFPDWRGLDDPTNSAKALKALPSEAIYYYFAEQQLWSLGLYRDGEPVFRYECIWMIDDFSLEGLELDEVADTLDLDSSFLEEVFYIGDGPIGWDQLAENAAQFADAAGLPNHAFASFELIDEDAEQSGMDRYFVGPSVGYDAEVKEPSPSHVEDAASSGDSPPKLGLSEEPKRVGGDAPWQKVYDLASQFLQRLHDEELIELTVDNRLARDRLIERLTTTVIENPIATDEQVLNYWLNDLMTCPEIVDIFATDAMLAEAYQGAKGDVVEPEADVDLLP